MSEKSKLPLALPENGLQIAAYRATGEVKPADPPAHTLKSPRAYAVEIMDDWGGAKNGVHYTAAPYLREMCTFHSWSGYAGAYDDPYSVTRYFLSNASTWRGPVARRIKKELREIVKFE